MHGLWWWIDRWRKSTAYIEMTLQEQGAYRNLLDEAWLRGGCLPADERILAKACGDPRAWKKVRAHVLSHFQLAPGGWHHDTLDEVMWQSTRRKENQRRYRLRQGASDNGADNGTDTSPIPRQSPRDNKSDNKPDSPDPDPDQEQGEGKGGPPLPPLFALWNTTVERLPKVHACSSDRKRHATVRLAEHPDLAWWETVFRRMDASDFLTARRPSKDHAGWRADIDFVLRPGNAERVLEGKYDNRESTAATPKPFGEWTPSEVAK